MQTFLTPNPDYNKKENKLALKKLSNPVQNKQALKELDDEFRSSFLSETSKKEINKKKVLDYISNVIEVINQKEDF